MSWASYWLSLISCARCGYLYPDGPECPQRNLQDADFEDYYIERRPLFGNLNEAYLIALIESLDADPPELPAWFQISAAPSGRAPVVLMFWTLIETLIEKLLIRGLQEVPDAIRGRLLDTH